MPGTPTVAVVNQQFVKKFFKPGEDPIGQHFGPQSPEAVNDMEIVGVVEDTVYTTVRGKTTRCIFVAPTQELRAERTRCQKTFLCSWGPW